MTVVSWPLIDSVLTAWSDDVNSLEDHSPKFPEALGMLHCRFEQMHPFLDGNARTGRLVLNLILVRLGYPPVVIHKRNRNKYLRALRRADNGEAGPIGELLARAILESLYRFVLPTVAGPARLVPLESLASPDVKASALRAAASRGRLQASRDSDGRWRSSRLWVDDYLRSRYQRQ
ncbi:MAG: Fic family protein [Acidimicrobiia bacterium]|nr:Fic family protein [Acidimicrobiia bacterium]